MNDHEPAHPEAPKPLPPEEHAEALKLEEARRLEHLKEGICSSHHTSGSAELPKVRSEDAGG